MAKKEKAKKVSKYQDRENYSEQTIQRVLYNHFKKMYYRMSNVYMFGGSDYQWECDFFFMSHNRYIWEIEIKVDRQDFDRDFQLKPKKHDLFRNAFESGDPGKNILPNVFYFCAPEGVIPHESVPEYAGLIEIHGDNKDQLRYVGESVKLHHEVQDVEGLLLKKFYNKCLRMENMLSDFRIKLFENPEKQDEILKKFLKTIRM